MWSNFPVPASLEIGASSRQPVRAGESARRPHAARTEMVAPPASVPESTPIRVDHPQRIAPALLAFFGVNDPEPLEPTQPMPLDDDTHVDLPVEDEEGDTVIELPIDDAAGGLSAIYR